jgi:hypothetical protein
MEHKQILPNYKDEYSKSDEWKVFETKHYIFHFFKNSVAEKEISFISETQEKAYIHIESALHLASSDKKIQYYFYPTEVDKEKMMGDDGFAQSIWHDNSVHAVYGEEDKILGEHEDTHLLTLSWNDSPVGFFQEGLAEYMRGCIWNKNDAVPQVKEAVKKNIFLRFENLFSHQFWTEIKGEDCVYYYPLAGYFTKYLFEKFGLEKYRRFYSSIKREKTAEENLKIFEEEYGNILLILKDFYLPFDA